MQTTHNKVPLNLESKAQESISQENTELTHTTTESTIHDNIESIQHKNTEILYNEIETKYKSIETPHNHTQNQDKESHTLKPEHIDYIIFLDSDDYWKLNCIETCIKHAEGVDIVWFDAEVFYDGMPQRKEGESVHALYKHKYNTKITRDEWAKIFMESNYEYFACAWPAFIDFSFLIALQLLFIDSAIYEDVCFGSLLFLYSRIIFVLGQKTLCV